MSELYALPDGWKWKKLVDKKVCELIMGQSPKSDTYNSDGVGMPFFQGKTEFGKMYPTVYKYCTAPKKIAHIGDILLSVRAPVGPTNIANIECCIGRGLGAIRPNQKNTLTNYLLYFFRNFELEISQKGKGSTFSAITKKELENTDIPIPPIQEQKRIVAKLDNLFTKIDQAITLHQQNIDEVEGFMGSVLNEIFEELEGKYKKNYLSNFCQITSSKRVYKDDYVDKGIPFYRIKDIVLKAKGYELKDMQFISLKRYEEFNKKFGSPKKGDILITAVGATLGYVYLVNNKDGDFYFKDGNIVWLKNITNNLVKEYIVYSFNSPLFQKYIEKISKGAAQPAITIIKLKELKIPIPPLKIQQKTVTYLDAISEKTETIKRIQKEKMQNLKDLKASILDKAFRGEL